jgi:hypothetical protein
MCAKSFDNRFPLSKLNRKRDFKRGLPLKNPMLPRKAGRGNRGISRRP